jgi:small GTP-binding protein
MKRIVLGILAHVDAGKTTLSEGLLYSSGAISRLGRVDKRDAFLDTHELERERGITIFSKQAIFSYGDTEFTLIDTPGHIDFSAEAERAVAIQDAAILVISATDGVTAHTKTLWNLLSAKGVPIFIFVNKTDISDRRRDMIMDELRALLSGGCVDFTADGTADFYENVAATDERLMDEYFSTDSLKVDSVIKAIQGRRVFPCMFGSALKMKGVEELLSTIVKYAPEKKYPENLGAKVYKISRDAQGKRLSYMKIVGGTLRNKDLICHTDKEGREVYEKVEEIRLYSADKYKSVGEASGGQVVAVLGLASTFVGEGIGIAESDGATLTPVLDYRLILPSGANAYETYMRLMVLSEEDPSLSLSYQPETHDIRIRLMGEIQTEIIKKIIADRFGIAVTFDEGSILYKETIAESVIGSGHFEPLRHYAEAHIRIDPLPRGDGIVTATECDTDSLSLNWQRLIITHLEEKAHRGVLTGSPITDVKLTLIAGKAHLKHTEGGDFRQATYRAVRQGLRKAQSILLEPTFDFRLEVPRGNLGRAMTDITNMHGVCEAPEFDGETAILVGNAPVKTMRSYATEVRAYTGGEGKLSMTIGQYAPCHNADEVISERGYNPDLDERNTANSVFCKGGSGYAVPWNEADELMHIRCDGGAPRPREQEETVVRSAASRQPRDYHEAKVFDEELIRIFEQTFGKIKPRTVSERVVNEAASPTRNERPKKQKPKGDNIVIIDGYNFIFAIDELRSISEKSISDARDILVRLMCDYTSYRSFKAIIVFDGYKREGAGSVEELGSVSVIYTKERQTADAYIEKTTHDMADKHTVRVVTGDMQEQFVVLGAGGLRVSPREFWAEIQSTLFDIRDTIYLNNNNIKK